jgi:predicted MFS family arabinose efflux permease
MPASDPASHHGFIDSRAKGEYLRLSLLTFCIFFLNAHASMLAIIFTRHGLALPQIGLLLSLYGVPVVLFTFLTGTAAARFGSLGTARIGIFLMIAGFLSLAVTSWSFWPALGSRLTWGMGYGLMFSSIVTYAQSRLSSARFIYLFGIFSSMAPIGHALAPPWVEFLLQFNNDAMVFVIGALPAIIALALTFTLRPLAKPSRAGGLLNFGVAFDRSRLLPMVAVMVAGCMFGFLSSYMAPALHEKGVAVAWFFVATVFSMLSTRFLGMSHFEKLDPRLVVASGLSVMALAYFTLCLTQNMIVVAGCGLFFGGGYSVVYPVLSAWISGKLPPSERAGPQAAFNAVFHIGLLWMPLPVTFIIATLGYDGAIASLGLIGLVTALLLFGWKKA